MRERAAARSCPESLLTVLFFFSFLRSLFSFFFFFFFFFFLFLFTRTRARAHVTSTLIESAVEIPASPLDNAVFHLRHCAGIVTQTSPACPSHSSRLNQRATARFWHKRSANRRPGQSG